MENLYATGPSFVYAGKEEIRYHDLLLAARILLVIIKENRCNGPMLSSFPQVICFVYDKLMKRVAKRSSCVFSLRFSFSVAV